MIKEAIKSYKSDNRGSAIITGLVVSAVLMVLCLSLLLVAYSLFLSTSNATSDMPNKEMLYSAADVIGEEIVSQTVDVTSYTITDENTGAEGQETATTTTIPSALWDVIYKGISTGAWPYYKTGVDGHSDLKACSKYYQMTSIGSVKIIVQLYWEPPKGWPGDYTQLNGTLLNAVYRLYNKDGEVIVKAEKKYRLEIKEVVELINTSISVETGETYSFSCNDGKLIIHFICDDKNSSHSGCRISFTNNTGSQIDNWSMVIRTDLSISNYYNVNIKNNNDGSYLITPLSYTGIRIGDNNSLFGFEGLGEITSFNITSCNNETVTNISSSGGATKILWKWNKI